MRDVSRAVIEVRTYRTAPGARETLLDALRRRSFPAQRKLGMKILGPFPSLDDGDAFVWLRGFPALARREEMKNAFYGGGLWLNELESELMPLLADYDAVLVEDAVNLWDWWPGG